jgi:polysaccharide pyruvyl transferase WcaK-like protein
MKLAKLFGARTELYGIGAGPFNTCKGKATVKYYIDNYVDQITVRDTYSFDYLVNTCKVDERIVSIKVDPVANLNCKPFESPNRDESIACIYTPHFDRKIWDKHRSKWSQLKECYFSQVDTLINSNEKVKLVFFQENVELDLANEFKEKFGDKVEVIFPKDFRQAIEVLSLSKGIISFRLHGNILAHAMNIPYLPVIYHHKTKGFIDITKYQHSDLAIEVGEGINWDEREIDKTEWIEKTQKFLERLYNEENTVSRR